ncbi:MAG: putative phosphoserine phosphatase [Erysipelotrichaceae bacterium]|nr:MAG: putative phosphoserine [Erysipelotrichaceae bacterium]TXT19636.1 MAG: putative phosphoserine phosphatase [Erysipelotrichaceae bacterium]
MNVYDFDKTIYARDSSIDFYVYNLKKDWTLLRFFPKQASAMIRYKLKLIPKTQMKQVFYVYMKTIVNMEDRVKGFWISHRKYLRDFYLSQKKNDDVIISASPAFLLQPLIDEWGCVLIASVVDQNTGYTGENCWGPEKVKRFAELFDLNSIDEFYSDSLSDTPLAKFAKRAFFVSPNHIDIWPNL